MSSMLSGWWKGSEEKKEDKEEEEGEKPPSEQSGWTTGLSSLGGTLTQSVSGYASSLSDSVKHRVGDVVEMLKPPTGIVKDFQQEQEKFEKSQRRQKDAAVPPWVGYNEEEQMKAQIIDLSADSRNVLRDPPPGVEFPFDYSRCTPVAMAVLKEDPRLQALRFDLVPKKVSEMVFWRNYFYRVSLIKQSVQLSRLSSVENSQTEEASDGGSKPKEGGVVEEVKTVAEATTDTGKVQIADSDVSAEEFASDQPYNSESVAKEMVQTELDQLGVSSEKTGEDEDDPDMWGELQAELHDLEIEDGEEHLPANWEKELQEMLKVTDIQPDPDKT